MGALEPAEGWEACVRRLRSFVLLSAATIVGSLAVGALVDFVLREVRGAGADDSLALPLLFKIRGPLPTPPEVIIVSMDAASTAVLDLPPKTRDWPRSLHARLIKRLNEQGASAIAMDLDFARQTDAAEDEALGAAIEQAGNVVLVERVDRITGPGFAGAQRRQPVPTLLKSAGALVPAPIPNTAVVTQTWSFLPEPSGEEAATLPAATLHVYSHRFGDGLSEVLSDAGVSLARPTAGSASPAGWHDLRETMRLLRRELKGNVAASARAFEVLDARGHASLERDDVGTLKALVRLYRDPGLFYVNYYGPPGTIRTIPYHEALNGAPADDLAGKAVFIGAGSSIIRSADQIDTYRTAYAARDAGNFSGVEIHATAFANLLRGETLAPLGGLASAVCLIGFGIGATAVAYFLPRRRSGIAALLVICAYYATAQLLFNFGRLLVPLAVPVLIQVPAAFVAVHFARKPFLKKVVNGTCLVADVAGSTRLAGTLGPDRLRELLDSYWLAIGEVARSSSATVQTPQVGDSFVCFWPASTSDGSHEERDATDPGTSVDRSTRRRSCLAALEIASAVARFNAAHPNTPLPTRLGLHVGQLSVSQDLDGELCTVLSHTVDVATRFEQAGKTLLGGVGRAGSPILASAEAVDGLDDLLTRCLGHHDLEGVGRVAVYELIGERDRVGQAELDLCQQFAAALRLYEDGRLNEALMAFNEVLASSGEDGPSSYFAKQCAAKLAQADSIVAQARA